MQVWWAEGYVVAVVSVTLCFVADLVLLVVRRASVNVTLVSVSKRCQLCYSPVALFHTVLFGKVSFVTWL